MFYTDKFSEWGFKKKKPPALASGSGVRAELIELISAQHGIPFIWSIKHFFLFIKKTTKHNKLLTTTLKHKGHSFILIFWFRCVFLWLYTSIIKWQCICVQTFRIVIVIILTFISRYFWIFSLCFLMLWTID